MKKRYEIILMISLVILISGAYGQFASDNTINTNPTSDYYAGFNSNAYSSIGGGTTNTIQAISAGVGSGLGGTSLGSYWPQFKPGDHSWEDCNGATTDFLVAIPPAGCTPNVVRSDLLAEQNVPVFCKVSALKINPLIDVSAIKSISFTGSYPSGVSGISYHPARQAVKTYKTLVGGPFVDNAGYVVITLSRQADERNLSKWVEGNLTAIINYDAKHLFGTGQAQYYLEAGEEQVSFWNGKGFLEVEDVESGYAKINLYTRRDASAYKTFTLKEGEATNLIYFPGYYCSAGLRIRLNSIVAPEDMALLNIEGNQIWVRKGSKFLDDKCYIKAINVFPGSSGKIEINCAGKSFTLDLKGKGVSINNGQDIREYQYGDNISNYYLAYSGKDPQNQEFVILTNREPSELDISFINNHMGSVDWSKRTIEEFRASISNDKEGKSKIGTYLTSPDEKTKGYFILYQGKELNGIKYENTVGGIEDTDIYGVNYELKQGEQTVKELVDFYPTEEKFEGEYWGEEALFQQITLTGQAGYQKTQMELIELFQQKYPSSDLLETAIGYKIKNGIYDYSKAHASVQINNEYFNIFVDSFKAEKDLDKSATIKIGGRSAEFVSENQKIEFDDGNLTIERIDVKGIQFRFQSIKDKKTQGKFIALDSSGLIQGREIEVRNIESRKVAYVSIEPEIMKTYSEANFAFKIGIEERNIKLNPDMTKDAIEGLNQTIAMWEETLDNLGKVIKVWKATCFATSTILMLETMLSGFSGESLARNKVMQQYKTICDTEIGKGTYSTRTQCYNAMSGQVDSDVSKMTQGINSVNNDLKIAQQGNTQTSGILGKESIIDQTKYIDNLKSGLSWDGVEIDGTKIETKDLTKSTEISKVMLYQKMGCKSTEKSCRDNPASDVVCCSAFNEMTAALKSTAIQKKANIEGERIATNIKDVVGGTTPPKIQTINSKNVRTLTWNGETGESYNKIISEIPEISKTDKIQFLNFNGKTYLVKLKESTLGGTMGVGSAYVLSSQSTWEKVSDFRESGLDGFVFLGGSKEACSNNIIKNPEVRYYESGRNKGLPAITPFDVQDGWYVYVPNSYGSVLEGTPKSYTSAGDVNFFWICNVGKNGVIEQKTGDDLCQSFSSNQIGFDTFISCGMQGREVGQLYSRARDAISQASAAYGVKGYIDIMGQNMKAGTPLTDTGGTECQDFMSPEDCKMLFNACDPVICPSSRCDLGGKYPVSDVVQTGIVGSIALCLPNAREGIIFPVCLTGIHAGIDAFVSILKSEKDCLQQNLDTGQYVGVCDEITAIYMCEFFWRNFGSLFDVLLPSVFENAFGQPTTRGGGEYQSVQTAWENLGKSMEFFTGFYAENSMSAFQLKNSQNIGTEICNGFLGTSIPLGLDAEGFDALLSPESPTQFYAYFSETAFSDATSPATSHYKVYYHIYAGNDFGASYTVYLKNPPASTYYATMSTANVKTGFVARGQSADESIDFTAPSGYKELCVRINNEEYCDFGTVSSDFLVNYATEKYTEDQATQTDITTEEGCVSTTSSKWGLASPNLQAGAETAMGGEDINLAGITRVCATSNPSIGISAEKNNVICNNDNDCGSGYNCEKVEGSEIGNCVDPNGNTQRSAGRWVDVGYCGDSNIRCWLDSSTLEGRFNAIDAVNQEIYGETGTVEDYVKYGQMFDELEQNYELARAKLSEQYTRIAQLTSSQLRDGDYNSEIASILQKLDEIIGLYTAGEGTSNDKAEALALKATIYRMIIEQRMKDESGIVATGSTLINDDFSIVDSASSEGPVELSTLYVETDTFSDELSEPTGKYFEIYKTIQGKSYISYGKVESPYYVVKLSSGNEKIMKDGSSTPIGSIDSTTGKITILEQKSSEKIGETTLGSISNYYYIDGSFALP